MFELDILIITGIVFAFLLIVVVLALVVPVSKDKTVCESQRSPVACKLVFSETARLSYADRMANMQPADNDRILEGNGKNHSLEAMSSVVTKGSTRVVSVLDQVGDIFS